MNGWQRTALTLCVKYLHRMPSECPDVTMDDLIALAVHHEEESKQKVGLLAGLLG